MAEENVLDTISADSILVLRDAMYYVSLLDLDAKEFDKDYAYLDGDYYYLYRGSKARKDMTKPGIYKDASTGKNVLIEPSTDEEKAQYSSKDKVLSHNPVKAAELINSNTELFIPVTENTKAFNPEITVNDDILKRVLKMVFNEKEIDIDNYKDRFPDKNALFNFKQVMKNPTAHVTMKIFERACDVVNVEYMITIREKPNAYRIGKSLNREVVVSSEDTFDYGAIGNGESDEDAYDEVG